MAPRITCICGACEKCKRRIYMRGYYRRNAQAVRDTANRSRARRLEKVRAYDRERGKTRQRDPVKERARMVITHLIEDGKLQRQPCEVCGAPNAEAHHEDYSRPRDVLWRCRPHHMELHRTVAA